jgi:hypothetical protein
VIAACILSGGALCEHSQNPGTIIHFRSGRREQDVEPYPGRRPPRSCRLHFVRLLYKGTPSNPGKNVEIMRFAPPAAIYKSPSPLGAKDGHSEKGGVHVATKDWER